MKVLVLRSSFQTDEFVKKEYAELIHRLQTASHAEIDILGDEQVETVASPSLLPNHVMIATGGVENLFKRTYTAQRSPAGPLQIIADGRNNSLAAALEILTYLNNNHREGRIIHGSNDEILAGMANPLYGARIGLFGQPSDWLIASGVDRQFLWDRYHVETVDIDLQRVIDGIKEIPQNEAVKVSQDVVKRSKGIQEPSCADMVEAAKTYLAIKKICQEERLDAMTIRCFDIVKACHTTSCMALALLNDEGIVAGCEGDMQTLLSMLLVKRLCGEEAFMANPSQLTDHSTMLAHCTIPLKMCDEIVLRSHFESSQGVAIQGLMLLTDYTIFKWGGPRLDRYFVTEAKAVETAYSEHFCRTQITLDVDMKPYLLQHAIGNHHVIIRGRHAKSIKKFFDR